MADLFQKVLQVFDRIGLWEDGIELIGSWSFLLYQRHLGVPDAPLRTQDIDFLLPRPYPKRTAVDLEAALSELGFRMKFTSSGVAQFFHPDLKLEFLMPERGSGKEEPRTVKSLGIKAVQLRYLDILLDKPVILQEGTVNVRVPKPLNFCLHKLIIAQRRKNKDKREKDIDQALYTLRILEPGEFQKTLDSLPKGWRALISKSLKQAWNLFPIHYPILEKFSPTLKL